MKKNLVYMGPYDRVAFNLHSLLRLKLVRNFRAIYKSEDIESLTLDHGLLMLRLIRFDERGLNLFIRLDARVDQLACLILAEAYDPQVLLKVRPIANLSYLNPVSELHHLPALVELFEATETFGGRAHPRTSTVEDVSLRFEKQKELRASLIDTSQMGARVRLKNALEFPAGPIELVRFNAAINRYSRILSKTVWQSRGSQGVDLGLQFISILSPV